MPHQPASKPLRGTPPTGQDFLCRQKQASQKTCRGRGWLTALAYDFIGGLRKVTSFRPSGQNSLPSVQAVFPHKMSVNRSQPCYSAKLRQLPHTMRTNTRCALLCLRKRRISRIVPERSGGGGRTNAALPVTTTLGSASRLREMGAFAHSCIWLYTTLFSWV